MPRATKKTLTIDDDVDTLIRKVWSRIISEGTSPADESYSGALNLIVKELMYRRHSVSIDTLVDEIMEALR